MKTLAYKALSNIECWEDPRAQLTLKLNNNFLIKMGKDYLNLISNNFL